jgi:hypothetical protein
MDSGTLAGAGGAKPWSAVRQLTDRTGVSTFPVQTTPVRQPPDGPSSTEEGSSAAGGSPPDSGGAGALATGVVTGAHLGNFLAARKCRNSRAVRQLTDRRFPPRALARRAFESAHEVTPASLLAKKRQHSAAPQGFAPGASGGEFFRRLLSPAPAALKGGSTPPKPRDHTRSKEIVDKFVSRLEKGQTV